MIFAVVPIVIVLVVAVIDPVLVLIVSTMFFLPSVVLLPVGSADR